MVAMLLSSPQSICNKYEYLEGSLHYAWPAPKLITERVVGGHVSGIGSIPVITHARVSFFKFKNTEVLNMY
jgi:hypothetical protein